MNRKTKRIFLLVLAGIILIFSISRLKIQSVSDYQKESEEIAYRLQAETVTDPPEKASICQSASSAGIEAVLQSTKRPDKTKVPSDTKEQTENKTSSENNKTKKITTQKKKAQKKKAQKKNSDSKEKKESRNKTKGEEKSQSTPSQEEKLSCTIEIRCDVLKEKGFLGKNGKFPELPEDGILLPKTRVNMEKGTTVYDLLSQVCRVKSLALDAVYTPMYGTYYVRGIAHLYEMDAGDMSGWLYTVNGKKPDIGASVCKLTDGDAIVWSYSCDGTLSGADD